MLCVCCTLLDKYNYVSRSLLLLPCCEYSTCACSAVPVGMSVHMRGSGTSILPAQLLQQLPKEIVRTMLAVCNHAMFRARRIAY